MNRKNSTKSTTPKKKSTSKVTPKKKKTSKGTPMKAKTPLKSPRNTRSRNLPKSPISETMRQTKIQDFFPSQSKRSPIASNSCLSVPDCSALPTEPSVSRSRKEPKKSKVVSENRKVGPVFGTKRTLRNTRSATKKLDFEANDVSTDRTPDIILIDSPKEPLISNKNLSEDEPMVCSPIKTNKNLNSGHNLSEMMVELTLNDIQNNLNELNSQTSDCVLKSLNQESELPVFKMSIVPKRMTAKEKAKNDKNKEKKMKYLLKNMNRTEKDKQIVSLKSVDEIPKSPIETTTGPNVSDINWFEEFDVFVETIPSIASKYLAKDQQMFDNIDNSCQPIKLLINRISMSNALEMFASNESEIQSMVFHVMDSITSEVNDLVFSQVKHKIFEFMFDFDNDLELNLSQLLHHFYKVLSIISTKLNDCTDKYLIEKEINSVLNLLVVMSEVLNKCDFTIEAIDKDSDLMQLLITGFALGLDFRLIESNKTSIVQNFISMVFKHIFMDETKTRLLFNQLISFCGSKQRCNPLLSLKIASLFPSEIDVDFKQKFAISVITLFVSNGIQDLDLNLNDIVDILERIQWKSLSPQEVYLIIQMIAMSLDMTQDYNDYQETISSILKTLSEKISTSCLTSSESELNETQRLLSFLVAKVKLFTK